MLRHGPTKFDMEIRFVANNYNYLSHVLYIYYYLLVIGLVSSNFSFCITTPHVLSFPSYLNKCCNSGFTNGVNNNDAISSSHIKYYMPPFFFTIFLIFIGVNFVYLYADRYFPPYFLTYSHTILPLLPASFSGEARKTLNENEAPTWLYPIVFSSWRFFVLLNLRLAHLRSLPEISSLLRAPTCASALLRAYALTTEASLLPLLVKWKPFSPSSLEALPPSLPVERGSLASSFGARSPATISVGHSKLPCILVRNLRPRRHLHWSEQGSLVSSPPPLLIERRSFTSLFLEAIHPGVFLLSLSPQQRHTSCVVFLYK